MTMITVLLAWNLLTSIGILGLLMLIAFRVKEHDRNFDVRMWEVTEGFIETTKALQQFAVSVRRPYMDRDPKTGLPRMKMSVKPKKEIKL